MITRWTNLHSCVSHICVRIFALATCLLDDVVVLAAVLISLPCGLCVVCVVLRGTPGARLRRMPIVYSLLFDVSVIS